MALLMHTLGVGPYMPQYRSAQVCPLLLEEVLLKHPDLRLYLENAGYPYCDEMIAVRYQFPQLYIDVSTITWVIPKPAFYGYLELVVGAGWESVIFGSDQMVWPEKIGAAVDAIDQVPFLTKSEKRDILHNNTVTFLGLKGDIAY